MLKFLFNAILCLDFCIPFNADVGVTSRIPESKNRNTFIDGAGVFLNPIFTTSGHVKLAGQKVLQQQYDDTDLKDEDFNDEETFEDKGDPCGKARAAAVKATGFSQDTVFTKAIQQLQWIARDGKEHNVAFGKDVNGSIITSAISTGNKISAKLGSVINKFADLHNHPGNTPPSSGDIYGLIDQASSNHLFETRYIITPAGTVYALVITDLLQARDFNTTYPGEPNPGYQPKFPEVIVDAIIDMKGVYDLNEEMAMAYVLEYYKMGIALLKQDNKGNFIPLNVDEGKNAEGRIFYFVNNCQ
jgi:hypothetical protein